MGEVVLGVDWGRRRVGVAASDELGLLAHPVTTLEAPSLDALVQALLDLARERAASKVVLGLPMNMDGSEGESAAAVRELGSRMEKQGLTVLLWDERLSSRAAEARLREGGTGRPAKGRVDRAAAAVLLQAYLDRERGGRI